MDIVYGVSMVTGTAAETYPGGRVTFSYTLRTPTKAELDRACVSAQIEDLPALLEQQSGSDLPLPRYELLMRAVCRECGFALTGATNGAGPVTIEGVPATDKRAAARLLENSGVLHLVAGQEAFAEYLKKRQAETDQGK